MAELYQTLDVDRPAGRADAVAMIRADLEDFITRHRACGLLTGDATEPEPTGYMVTVICSCGVMFVRWVSPEEAALEVVLGQGQAL